MSVFTTMLCHYLAEKQEEADQEVERLKADIAYNGNTDLYGCLAVACAKRSEVDEMTTDILKILRYYDK